MKALRDRLEEKQDCYYSTSRVAAVVEQHLVLSAWEGLFYGSDVSACQNLVSTPAFVGKTNLGADLCICIWSRITSRSMAKKLICIPHACPSKVES
jgi:hypothetical protein